LFRWASRNANGIIEDLGPKPELAQLLLVEDGELAVLRGQRQQKWAQQPLAIDARASSEFLKICGFGRRVLIDCINIRTEASDDKGAIPLADDLHLRE
jgi:hypothetical protein